MDYINEAINFLCIHVVFDSKNLRCWDKEPFDEVITTMIEEWPARHVSCNCHMNYIMWYNLVAYVLLCESNIYVKYNHNKRKSATRKTKIEHKTRIKDFPRLHSVASLACKVNSVQNSILAISI